MLGEGHLYVYTGNNFVCKFDSSVLSFNRSHMCVVKIEYKIKKQADRARPLKIRGKRRELSSSKQEGGGIVEIGNKLQLACCVGTGKGQAAH